MTLPNLTLILYTAFCFWWVMKIIYKLTGLDTEGNYLHLKTYEISYKPLSSLLSKLLDCELCIESWISIIYFCLLAICLQDYRSLMYIPIGPAFSHIIKSLSK